MELSPAWRLVLQLRLATLEVHLSELRAEVRRLQLAGRNRDARWARDQLERHERDALDVRAQVEELIV